MKRDFAKLHQQKHQSMQDYYDQFVPLREVNQALGNNVYYDLVFVVIIVHENGEEEDQRED